jgi:microcystin-dependent protein
MGIVNPTLPTPGDSRASEEVDVRNALTEILAEFNGNIDLSNLSAALQGILVPTPAGTLAATALALAPSGWLLCDGQPVTSENPELRQALLDAGSPYGVSGADPRVPDLRGRTPVMAGQGAGLTNRALGQAFGAETHALTEAQLAAHDHPDTFAVGPGGTHNHNGLTSTEGEHNHGGNYVTTTGPVITGRVNNIAPDGNGQVPVSGDNSGFAKSTATGDAGLHNHLIDAVGNHVHPLTGAVSNAGAGQAHNNVQPSLAVNWMVKT